MLVQLIRDTEGNEIAVEGGKPTSVKFSLKDRKGRRHIAYDLTSEDLEVLIGLLIEARSKLDPILKAE